MSILIHRHLSLGWRVCAEPFSPSTRWSREPDRSRRGTASS